MSSDLRSAIAVQRARLRQAEERAAAAEAMLEGEATNAQARTLKAHQRHDRRDTPAPTAPDVKKIERRREVRTAERAALEAEVQALATADDIVKAMETEEVTGTRRTWRERRSAARAADQEARDRKRAGKAATATQRGQTITLGRKANGDREVGKARTRPTPEEIARRETDSE